MGDSMKKAQRVPPALNPEQLGLVQPWKDFVSRGLVTDLSVTFTPGGTNVVITVAASVPVPDGTSRTGLPPGMARQLIIDSGLAPIGKKAKAKEVVQPLPARSITAADVEGDNLEKRIVEVANKLGSSTALGRIGSMQMNLQGSTTFADWWSTSKNDQKVKLVMDDKHWKTLSEQQASKLLGKIGQMKSPFLGPIPVKSLDDKAEKEDQKKQERPSSRVRDAARKVNSKK